MALEMATLGRRGVPRPHRRARRASSRAPSADVAVWPLTGPAFAGALADPIEAWLRCGPVAAWHTIVNGRFVVRDGNVVHDDLDHMLRSHAAHAARIQRLAG